MTTIKDILIEYHSKIDYLDLELLIAHELQKSREFVLAHPEYQLTPSQLSKVKGQLLRRAKHEPLAYILSQKEFFGLDFRVNKHTLIPRPETELLVEFALRELQTTNHQLPTSVIDIGTGSGNIIISVAKNSKAAKYFGIDISKEAIKIAKRNAKLHKVDKKIKFLHGSLLEPFPKQLSKVKGQMSMVILANLPYLSKEIYNATAPTVKKFEPKSALFSPKDGLDHYEKLLKQIKLLVTGYGLRVTGFLEISPEQKIPLTKLIKSHLPEAKIEFFRDLSGKWRICKISC